MSTSPAGAALNHCRKAAVSAGSALVSGWSAAGQRLGVVLGGVQHHVNDAIHIAVGGSQRTNIDAQAAGLRLVGEHAVILRFIRRIDVELAMFLIATKAYFAGARWHFYLAAQSTQPA